MLWLVSNFQYCPTSVIYRCVPPTLEYGTRPFLRWVRSQGRSPHASGKAKNTFSPVGIPLFGAPQAPGNNPPPKEVKSWGMAPWGRRNSPVPRHTRQNRPEIKRLPNATQQLDRKKRSEDLFISSINLWIYFSVSKVFSLVSFRWIIRLLYLMANQSSWVI